MAPLPVQTCLTHTHTLPSPPHIQTHTLTHTLTLSLSYTHTPPSQLPPTPDQHQLPHGPPTQISSDGIGSHSSSPPPLLPSSPLVSPLLPVCPELHRHTLATSGPSDQTGR